MLLAVSQSSFLLIVAVINLLIGFALGRRAASGETLLPLGVRLLLRRPTDSSAAPATSGVASSAAGDVEPQASAANSQPAGPATADAGDDISFDGTITKLTHVVEEGVDHLQTIRRQLASDGGSPSVDAAELAAAEIDERTQQLLQKINSTTDRLGQLASESPESASRCQGVTDLLETLWRELNDALVQLVILTFDEETLDDAARQLDSTIEEITSGCRTMLKQIGKTASASPPAQGTSA